MKPRRTVLQHDGLARQNSVFVIYNNKVVIPSFKTGRADTLAI
jgi:hypothetical protein